MFGVCNIAVIPLRSNPSHRSEMVSQLLFGDAYSVIDEDNEWFKISTTDYPYEGWIEKKMHNALHPKDVEDYISAEKYFVRDYLLFIKEFETGITFPIFAGSSFPMPQNDMLILGNSIFIIKIPEQQQYKGNDNLSAKQMSLLQFASSYLQAPYLWGGRTPTGIDCSGFVQIVFKSIGVSLPRNASQQVNLGNVIDFIHETKVGDIAYFQNQEGIITHTGIICDKEKIIHASGKVRIDLLDQEGIYNRSTEKYTHQLRVIKRLDQLC